MHSAKYSIKRIKRLATHGKENLCKTYQVKDRCLKYKCTLKASANKTAIQWLRQKDHGLRAG
jgi:hypothetical protein